MPPARRAGGPWTAGLELQGFGIHLPTSAPGLPVHEPAVIAARDLHAARCSTAPAPPAPPAGRPHRYRIQARERKRRPPLLAARSSSLNRWLGTGRRCCCSWKRKRSAAGDRDFEPLQVATTKGPLSVGGLLAVGVSGDCVEASFSNEPFDRRHGRSYPGPVWVDICCDAPRVV